MIDPGQRDLTILQGATFDTQFTWFADAPADIELRYLGALASQADLPASAQPGDLYYVTEAGSPPVATPFYWRQNAWNALPRTDITGWSARLQIRRTKDSADVVLDLSSEDGGLTLGGTAGTIDVLIEADATAELIPREGYVYDLKVYSAAGTYVGRLFQGLVTVDGEVTR